MAEYCSNCGAPYTHPKPYTRACAPCGTEERMEKYNGEGRTWAEHCRLANEPEGRETGLHRDSMG